MKYTNRVYHNQAFEREDRDAYVEAARAARMDLTTWIQSLCARAIKRDRRNPANRTHARGHDVENG